MSRIMAFSIVCVLFDRTLCVLSLLFERIALSEPAAPALMLLIKVVALDFLIELVESIGRSEAIDVRR